MKTTPRKGLQDMPTRSSLTSDAENPQRRFLRVASLELRKALCIKMRDVARSRVVEMERKIAELEIEEARLLAAAEIPLTAPPQMNPALQATSMPGGVARRGLTLKY
jgi:hypothetical protein